MERKLILCAGRQERWLHDHDGKLPLFKQLVEVDGQVLIKRIQSQFPNAMVVTNAPEIIKHSKYYFEPEDTRATICTLYSTMKMWDEWNTILLGDVSYGQKTIDLISSQTAPMMFYGNRQEIFAVKFHVVQMVSVVKAIHSIVNDKLWSPKFGKLWNLYRRLNLRDYRVHDIYDFFTFVSDCEDFDNCEQYYKYAKDKAI